MFVKAKSARSKDTMTYFLRGSFLSILENYKRSGMTFTLYLGGKSHKIEFQKFREKYVTSFVPKRAFIGANMVVSDVKRPEVQDILSDIKDYIDEDNNRYFGSTPIMPHFVDECYLVDINSAYLSVLKKYELISDKTYGYILGNCTKEERLVAVGMLARKKNIYKIVRGAVVSHDVDEAETRYLFNFCIQETDDAMQLIAKELPDQYLFYWVDGIYLTDQKAAEIAVQILSENGFKSKVKLLRRLTCLDIGVRKEVTFYEVDAEGKEKEKFFRIPNARAMAEFNSEIRNILQNGK